MTRLANKDKIAIYFQSILFANGNSLKKTFSLKNLLALSRPIDVKDVQTWLQKMSLDSLYAHVMQKLF